MPVRARRWLVYPPLRDIFPRLWIDHWTALTYTEPRIYIVFPAHPCSSVVDNIPPFSAQGILIWAQFVDIVVNYISVFPCPSVLVSGWYIPHWETSFCGMDWPLNCTDLHWTKDIYIVFPCPSVLVGGWHTSFHAPRRLRHIPDTYPIHTRHIPDTYVYPMNTLRIPHEYPTQKTAMREVEFSSPLAVLCTAVARRVFHASVRMVR